MDIFGERAMLIAISAEGAAKNVRSGAFIKKYHLPSYSITKH